MQSVLTRIVKGAAAGLVATAAMSALMLGARRLGALGEPPPRRLTRRLLSPLGPLRPTGPALDVAATIAHFSYGAFLGSLYGALPGRSTRARGLAYGLSVWAANYALALPALGLMPPARKDRLGRPSSMIASHLVYGATLAGCYRRLASERVPLRDKVVVVCGGSRGLGRALARESIEQGARVAICGRSPESLEQARSWLESYGAPVLARVCDLRDEDQTSEFLAQVSRELGPVDVLIASAAAIEVGPIESLKADDFHASMREIFGSALHAALGVLPAMQARRRGTIVFINSIGGKLGVPHLAPYSAAKFAQVGLAEALSAEIAKDGVQVLTVMPGLMRTGSHVHAQFRGAREREFAWFGASVMTPLLSIDADRAARYIVRAIARGDRFLTFTPAAHLGAWLHDAAPELWSFIAGLAGRLLPAAPAGASGATAREGAQLALRGPSPLVNLFERRSAALAAKHNQ